MIISLRAMLPRSLRTVYEAPIPKLPITYVIPQGESAWTMDHDGHIDRYPGPDMIATDLLVHFSKPRASKWFRRDIIRVPHDRHYHYFWEKASGTVVRFAWPHRVNLNDYVSLPSWDSNNRTYVELRFVGTSTFTEG